MLSPSPSRLRLLAGAAYTAVVVAAMLAGLVALLPFGRRRRILFTNRMGTVLGRGVMWLSGSRVMVHGREHAVAGQPVIYANNHSSNLDAFLTIWLTPDGTVGLAKKEIVYYPFYGAAWLLSGHPMIDRGHAERARVSMRKLGEFVRRERFSVCMLPEGTRSRDGRLLPFKKGIVHLAVQTGLPIVPMVTVGAAGAWDKGRWAIQARDIHVHFLPPIDTSGWTLESVDEHLEALREQFLAVLPDEMRPERPRAAA